MFGRRRLAEAEADLMVKKENQKVASENYIAVLENGITVRDTQIAALQNQIAAEESLVAALKNVILTKENQIAILEDWIVTWKDLSAEQAKEAIEGAYLEIEKARRISAGT
jgi:hypothetical protein